jgi:hypothetical protein
MGALAMVVAGGVPALPNPKQPPRAIGSATAAAHRASLRRGQTFIFTAAGIPW